MWVQEWVIRFKARSPRRESWTRAARTLSSWGGVIYDFSLANKEEKWGKKNDKAVLHTWAHCTRRKDTLWDTREGGSNICTWERAIRPSRHTYTHSFNSNSANTATWSNNNTSFACAYVNRHIHSFFSLNIHLVSHSMLSQCFIPVCREVSHPPSVALIFLTLLFSLLSWQTRISARLFLTNNELNSSRLGCRSSSSRENEKLKAHISWYFTPPIKIFDS